MIPVSPMLFTLCYSSCYPPRVPGFPTGNLLSNLQDRPFILQLSSLSKGESAAAPARSVSTGEEKLHLTGKGRRIIQKRSSVPDPEGTAERKNAKQSTEEGGIPIFFPIKLVIHRSCN